MAGEIAWGESSQGQGQGDFSFTYTLEDAIQNIQSAADGEYMDSHQWCFVPHSFRMMMDDLYNMGIIAIREVSFIQSHGCEFLYCVGSCW
jgi:hypothetical protein